MAHELDMSNGRANFAYVGAPAWHGLGFELEEGAPLERWREVAGLDWRALETPALYHFTPEGADAPELLEHDGRKVLVRSDTGAALANLSNDYRTVQPGDVLEFFRDLTDASSGLFTLETAGSLFGGRRIWALARSRIELDIAGSGDIVKPYLLLATSLDGSMATLGRFTTTRVVCNNTLGMADRERGPAIRIPHSTDFDATKVKAELGLIEDRSTQFLADANELARIQLPRADALEFFTELFGRETPAFSWPERAMTDAELDALPKPRLDRIERALEAFESAPGAELPGARGTMWGAVNAVTFLADHDGRGKTAESRFNSAQFGDESARKAAAWNLAGEVLASIRAGGGSMAAGRELETLG